MKKRIAMFACAAAAAFSFGTVTAFAAEPPANPPVETLAETPVETPAEEPAASYSYLAGRERSQSRMDLYAQAEEIESEEERETFLAENGINDTEWSEEAAAEFSYVAGRQRGASYRSDDTDDSENADAGSYSYVTGQQRGSSYRR